MALELGDVSTTVFEVRTRDGSGNMVLTNPASLTILVQPPNNLAQRSFTTADAEVSNTGTGKYELAIATDQTDEDEVGRWELTMTTVAPVGVQSHHFVVQRPRVL
jgi:hypothetical protein